MAPTSRCDGDIVAELETFEEVLLYLDPDEIDYVGKQPPDLQDGAARRLDTAALRIMGALQTDLIKLYAK
ncbi:hypothetical protein JCM10295v2_000107 [Rhodotorula toruloides]